MLDKTAQKRKNIISFVCVAGNAESFVIMYADVITASMQRCIDETNRRRVIQMRYNEEHGITPTTIVKPIRDVIELKAKDEIAEAAGRGKSRKKNKADDKPMTAERREELLAELTAEMKEAAKHLEFERAAYLRDRINEIKASGEKHPGKKE